MSSLPFKILFIFLLLPIATSVAAADKKKEETVTIPMYEGVQVGFDFLSPVRSLVSDNYGASVKADVNLWNKYFPTLEVGFANYDKTSDTNNHFTSTGRFFKIGVNKALTYRGPKAENLFFIGAHYGFSAFSYNLDHLTSPQNYWENAFDLSPMRDEHSAAGWLELVAGVRVKVLGPVSLGWTAQYKSTLHVSNGDNSIPAYIPGYGTNVRPNAGMTFHIYYKLPF